MNENDERLSKLHLRAVTMMFKFVLTIVKRAIHSYWKPSLRKPWPEKEQKQDELLSVWQANMPMTESQNLSEEESLFRADGLILGMGQTRGSAAAA
jgi:hypothetical protein